MAWTFILSDLRTDTQLLDVTQLVQQATVTAMLNKPLTIELQMNSNIPELWEDSFEGDPVLAVGTRTIKAYQDGTLRGHGIGWTLGFQGDENTNPMCTFTCNDPIIKLPTRTLYDVDGRVADFDWPPGTYTGGNIFKDAISYSKIYDDAVVGGVTPALFPIDTFTGVDTTTTDLSAVLTDTPITLADLYTLLVDTGAIDIICKPVDSSFTGIAAGQIGALSFYEAAGSDISGAVHFDYATGLKNVAQARRLFDMTTVANKIAYELGPKISSDHWRGNITGTESGLEAWQALQLASRHKYGAGSVFRVYDSNDDDNAGRVLYHRLWKTEVNLRTNPRDLVYMTPVAEVSFRPFVDYNLGDIVGINSAVGYLGPAITDAKQRIYGFQASIGPDGVERGGELVTSADAESGAG